MLPHGKAGSSSVMERGDGKKRKTFAAIIFFLFLSLLTIMLVTALSLPHILDASSVQYGPHLEALHFFAGLGSGLGASSSSQSSYSSDEPYHMVFSTSCSAFQDWQSYAFFYHAWKVKQPGTITRIVTGCKPEKEVKLRRKFQEQIAPFSDKFHLYFTPDFSALNKGHYQTTKYFNKPFGVLDWLEKAVGFPNVTDEINDSMFIIMDPDMLLTRPLVNSFEVRDILRTPKTSGIDMNDEAAVIHVTHGHPVAARYGYGGGWLKGINANLTHVVGPDSPVHDLSIADAGDFFSIGPPYIATGKDMFNLVSHWADMTPRVYDIHHQFLSEMFGFSCAAAHLQLPPTVFKGLMMSDVGSPEEGWSRFLDDIPKSDVCKPIPREKMPPVMHYCQRYALGRWFFGKYKLHENFFTCYAPLLRVPPEDLAVRFDYYIYPNTERVDYKSPWEDLKIKSNGFGACFLIDTMNEAGEYYRRNHCPKGANFSKSFIFHTDITEEQLYSREEKTT